MNFFARLFGAGKPAPRESPPPSQIASGQSSQHSQSAVTQAGTRREMLRVVLRDTLNRHGIPTWWIAAETLNATSRTRPPGIHWRLSIRQWDPRLLLHCVALQNSLIRRAQTFDPMVETWLMGISWQFALPDEAACPPMPHPGLWTADPHPIKPEAVYDSLPGGSADVIAGPVRIGAAPSNAATQPLFLRTEPAKLQREP
jgi:hypothetical protein